MNVVILVPVAELPKEKNIRKKRFIELPLTKSIKNKKIMPRIKKTKNQVIVVPSAQAKPKIMVKFARQAVGLKKTKSKRIKTNPIDYYTCLTNMAQAGFPDKITVCCRSCKQN